MNLLLLAALLLGGSDDPALERALATVSPDAICADVRFIASDELEGRDTPSKGLRLAARYLRARLERLGLQPMGDSGWFDEYALVSTELDAGESGFIVRRQGEETRLVYGEDCFTRGDGFREHELEAPVTFVRLGTVEDFQGLDLTGRWAMVESSREVPYTERERNARAAGALGVLTVTLDEGAERFLRRMGTRGSRIDVGSSDDGYTLPQVWLSVRGTRVLLGQDLLPNPWTNLPVFARDRRVVLPEERVVLENVCGFWPGSDPELKHEVVVFSAHYDHVGKPGGVIHNGADDNGSGTSGLLALAEALKAHGPLRRSVLLLWVSGEEKGLWGSEAWTRAPTLPDGYRAVCNLNVDMIGRNEPAKLLITPTSEHEEYNGLTRLAEELGPLEGFPVLGSADAYWRRSDHANFSRHLGIPVAFLFADEHEDYHRPGDDAEKIDCDKIARVVRLLLRMLAALQDDELDL
jgi:hypothetical protein